MRRVAGGKSQRRRRPAGPRACLTFLKKIPQDLCLIAKAMSITNPSEWITAFLATTVALVVVSRSMPLSPWQAKAEPLATALCN